MAENQKSIFIRFNMDDRADRELYLKLSGEAGNAVSLTAYVKKVLEEYFRMNIKIADRQEFHNQMLTVIREEMQSQGMKLVGALLAGISTVNVIATQTGTISKEAELPDVCVELPEELRGILDFIG